MANTYLYRDLGCSGCHSIQMDKIVTGPSFKGKWGWGETVFHTDGTSSQVDENYIANSIRKPAAKIVKGFTNQMNQDFDKLPQEDINAIIEFIKSLKE